MRLKAETQRLYEEIWRTTFGDSEEFIALYSRTTFDPHRTHLLTALDPVSYTHLTLPTN